MAIRKLRAIQTVVRKVTRRFGGRRAEQPPHLTFDREKLQNADRVGLGAFGRYIHARLGPGEMVHVATFTQHALDAARWMEFEKEKAQEKLSQSLHLTKNNAHFLGLLGEAHNELHDQTIGTTYDARNIVLELARHAGNEAFVEAVRRELIRPSPR